MAVSTHTTGQYLHAAKDLRLETRELPALGADEVQVAIRSTTLCGSDLHYFSHFKNGPILVREPLCLGHEAAGEVIAAGPSVTNLKVGDAVALEVGVPCEVCDFCSTERYNICPNLRFRGSGSKFPHYQGTLQERVNHPARWAYKLPPELDFEIGALLEPLAVALHALRRAEACTHPFSKDSCLIFGAGAVGLLTAAVAQARGVKNVVMVDIHQGRLKFALEHGFATAVYPVTPHRAATVEEAMAVAAEIAREIGEIRWPDGKAISKVDVTFECTGVPACVQASIFATRSGGSVISAGLGTTNLTLPISEATAREIALVPIWRYAGAYPAAMEIAAASVTGTAFNGRTLPNIRLLITHRYEGLGSVEEAFKTAGSAGDTEGGLVVKTVVNFPETGHMQQ